MHLHFVLFVVKKAVLLMRGGTVVAVVLEKTSAAVLIWKMKAYMHVASFM